VLIDYWQCEKKSRFAFLGFFQDSGKFWQGKTSANLGIRYELRCQSFICQVLVIPEKARGWA